MYVGYYMAYSGSLPVLHRLHVVTGHMHVK